MPAPLSAAAEEAAPEGPVSVTAVVVTTAPTIDGVLDDACWEEATHITDFWREREDEPPIENTEAWICYDSEAIYVAFRCHDSKPSEIHYTQKKRQGRIWDDDRVLAFIDVSNTGRDFYSFQVTPAGTQHDGIPGGTSEKIEWKGDWSAAGSVDEEGWSAEIEIPFSILRYPDGQDTFRIWLARILARQDDWCTWPPAFARVWDADNCARWTGLTTPPVPFRCTFMPYALSVLSEDEEDRDPLTVGFDVKGTFPNGVVGLGTYNPDFRNLEDVVETIDFTYVERYLEEYRPFFREGEYYFPGGIFYSRRIEDFDLGAKAFGTLGHHRFGLLDTYSQGGENHFAWNYSHQLGTSGALYAEGTDTRVPDEPHNQAYEAGGYLSRRFEGGNHHGHFFRAWTRTEGEGGDDSRLSVGAGTWRLQGFGWNANYSATGSEFQADDGYVPETGVRNLSVGINYNRTYDEGAVKHFDWNARFNNGESEEGERRTAHLGYYREWRSGRDMWIGGSTGERDGFDQWDAALGLGWNKNDMYRDGGLGLTVGERYTHPYRYISISQAFHPSEKWSGQLRWERVYAADLDDDGNLVPPEVARQVVLTATYDITKERSVSGRLVRSSGNTNAYAAYRQRVRKGMDLLIVVGDPNADEWVSRLAVKAIWCF
jgi:hypothetical protein